MQKKYTMRTFFQKNIFILFVIIHVCVALLRMIFVHFGYLDLHSEEAQYWAWSQQMDWSYYSKPPMVAICNYISEGILGHSELAVRINAIIFGFLTALVTYKFTYALYKDTLKSFVASLLVYVMPFFLGASLFFSTDAPLLFFFLWAMYQGWMAIATNKWKHWLWLAVALGLGYLSKYTMLLFVPCFALFLLIKDKKQLKNPRLYQTFGISLLFFLPVLIWNFQNDFISFRHVFNLSKTAQSAPYPISNRLLKELEYIGGQLAIISPLFLIMYYKAIRKYKFGKEALYVLLPALTAFLIFLGITWTRRSGANVNWTMYAYVGLPVLLANYIIDSKKLKTAAILYGITVGLLLLATNMNVMDSLGLGKFFPPKIDPSKKLIGWQKAAAEVEVLEKTLDTDKYFVFANTYHITSELRFYLYPQKDIFYYNMGHRMTQFELWKGIEQYANQGYSAIFVTSDDITKRNYEIINEAPPLPDKVKNAFDEKYSYHTKVIYYREKPITQFHFYILHNFKELKSYTSTY